MARSKYTKQDAEPADSDSPDTDVVSRSARKRESDALKALGMELAELSTRQLQDMELSEALYKAITDYQRITSNSAKRRQRGFIGGLLRGDTDEAEAIRARYTALTQHDADAKRLHHDLENWRDRLIESDEVLTEYLNVNAGAPAQELRLMIRRVRKARDEAQRKKATKILYRKLASIAQA